MESMNYVTMEFLIDLYFIYVVGMWKRFEYYFLKEWIIIIVVIVAIFIIGEMKTINDEKNVS